MGLYAALDSVLGGLLPGGTRPFWENQPSELSGAELVQAAQTGTMPAGMKAGSTTGKGKTVSLVGRMTTQGFVPRKLVAGAPIMTTTELRLLERARSVGRKLGSALGMVNAYRRGRVVFGRKS